MADLITVAAGLLGALLLVGGIMYSVVGGEMEWDETESADEGDDLAEFGAENSDSGS